MLPRQNESFARTRRLTARSGRRESSFGTDQAGDVRTGRQTCCFEGSLVLVLSDESTGLVVQTRGGNLTFGMEARALSVGQDAQNIRLGRTTVSCGSGSTTRSVARIGRTDLAVRRVEAAWRTKQPKRLAVRKRGSCLVAQIGRTDLTS